MQNKVNPEVEKQNRSIQEEISPREAIREEGNILEGIRTSLSNRNLQHDYLVCVDSDGCVFDNMELKHKECFCPATVNVWNLQKVSRYAREAAEFVNLYSRTRGTNRYPALVRTLELLGEREEAKKRGYTCPDLTSLKKWIRETDTLSLAALKEYYAAKGKRDPILRQTIQWSEEVDRNIAHIVRGTAIFPDVKTGLSAFHEFADVVIVSATPHETIVREWNEHGLLEFVTEVAGQELGTKEECIRKAMDGHYTQDHVLMIGDAPGDQKAAESNGVLFYPIIPGAEDASWQQAHEEIARRFRNESYRGSCMENKLEAFHRVLLTQPVWTK